MISESNIFRCIRPFILDGRQVARDEVLRFDRERAGLVNELLATAKLAPASAGTERCIKWQSAARWSKGDPATRPEQPSDQLWLRRYPR